MDVNTTELAKLLGITRRYVNILADKEGLPKKGRGKYDAPKAVTWYIEFIRNETEKKYKKKLEKVGKDDPQNRLNSYRADEALLNLLERQRRLVPVDEILKTWKNEIQLIKRELYGIPNKIAHKCLTAQSKTEIGEILNNSLDDVLEKYANGSINIFCTDTPGNNSPDTLQNGVRSENISQTKTKIKRK